MSIEMVAEGDGPERVKDQETLSALIYTGVDKIDDKVKAVFWVIGAGNENRTRNWSLGSSRDTFSPYPRTSGNITSEARYISFKTAFFTGYHGLSDTWADPQTAFEPSTHDGNPPRAFSML